VLLDRPDVLELFSTQHWVASRDQLGVHGVSAKVVQRAVREGLVVPIVDGVVALARTETADESRLMAVQLAGGHQAFLSGPTAGRLHGLRRMPAEIVEITVPETRVKVWPTWVRAVRTSWADEEARPARIDGLAVASPPRTLFGLAAQLSPWSFERAAEDMWHRGLLAPADAREYLQRVRRRGRTGVAVFERWLEQAESQTRPATTGMEQLLVDLARRAGLPDPELQHPVILRSGVTIHLDLAWPDVKFAVEPGHSWWHGGDERVSADQARDRGVAELGWATVRYDESVWHHQQRTVDELGRLYRAAASRSV
jgi:hypothetical protein